MVTQVDRHLPTLRDVFSAVRGINLHIAERLFEYYSAGAMLFMAILLAIPATKMTGAFAILMEWGWKRQSFLLFFAIFGSIRLFALVANGNLPHGGPVVRVTCSFLAAPVWCMLTIALLRDAYYAGELSMGLALYFPLMLCDMYASSRATLDVGR